MKCCVFSSSVTDNNHFQAKQLYFSANQRNYRHIVVAFNAIVS